MMKSIKSLMCLGIVAGALCLSLGAMNDFIKIKPIQPTGSIVIKNNSSYPVYLTITRTENNKEIADRPDAIPSTGQTDELYMAPRIVDILAETKPGFFGSKWSKSLRLQVLDANENYPFEVTTITLTDIFLSTGFGGPEVTRATSKKAISKEEKFEKKDIAQQEYFTPKSGGIKRLQTSQEAIEQFRRSSDFVKARELIDSYAKEIGAQAVKEAKKRLLIWGGIATLYGFKCWITFDNPGYLRIGGDIFKGYLGSASNNITLKGWDNSGSPYGVNRDSKMLNVLLGEYKIHLMPKGLMMLELGKLLRLIRDNQDLQKSIYMIKLYLLGSDEEMLKLSLENKPVNPKIVIYASTGQDAAQKVLDLLNETFKDTEGLDITPRYNQKITSLLYYAQGNANDKEMRVLREHFEEQPDMIHYKSDITGKFEDYKLKIPGGTEIATAEQPQETIIRLATEEEDYTLKIPDRIPTQLQNIINGAWGGNYARKALDILNANYTNIQAQGLIDLRHNLIKEFEPLKGKIKGPSSGKVASQDRDSYKIEATQDDIKNKIDLLHRKLKKWEAEGKLKIPGGTEIATKEQPQETIIRLAKEAGMVLGHGKEIAKIKELLEKPYSSELLREILAFVTDEYVSPMQIAGDWEDQGQNAIGEQKYYKLKEFLKKEINDLSSKS